MSTRTYSRGRFARRTLLAATLAGALFAGTLAGQTAEAVDGPVETVYIANGRNFPDALAGGVLAALEGAPMLLTDPSSLPADTIAELENLTPARIVVFGGPGAVDQSVEAALAQYAGDGGVSRIAGLNRYDTAALIARALPAGGGGDAETLDGLDSTDFARVDGDGVVTADGFVLREPEVFEVSLSAASFTATNGDPLRVADQPGVTSADSGQRFLVDVPTFPNADPKIINVSVIDTAAAQDIAVSLVQQDVLSTSREGVESILATKDTDGADSDDPEILSFFGADLAGAQVGGADVLTLVIHPADGGSWQLANYVVGVTVTYQRTAP